MEKVRVRIDADVKCTDRDGGQVDRVIIDPQRRRITHWVIRLNSGERVVIETSRIAEAQKDWIKLDMSYEELRAAPLFLFTDYSLPSAEWSPMEGYRHADVLWPSHQAKYLNSDLSPGPLPIEHEAITPEEREVAEGSRVHCRDRECGRVSEVLLSPETQKALGFIIRRGFLFHRDVSIPMGWIERIDSEGVHLKMTSKQVDELAQHFPREF